MTQAKNRMFAGVNIFFILFGGKAFGIAGRVPCRVGMGLEKMGGMA